MLRKRVFSLVALAIFLVLPSLAGAQGAATPAEVVNQVNTPLSNADLASPVEVRLSEYSIDMPHTLSAGPTSFLVHNEGRKTHSFKIEGPGIAEILEKPVRPGTTSTLNITLQPGEYRVYCPIGSHEVKGMTMKITVTAK